MWICTCASPLGVSVRSSVCACLSARHASATSVTNMAAHRHQLLLARVDDADLLVLAGGADEAAVATPAGAEDHVGVHVLQRDHGLARAHVPNDDLVVAA